MYPLRCNGDPTFTQRPVSPSVLRQNRDRSPVKIIRQLPLRNTKGTNINGPHALPDSTVPPRLQARGGATQYREPWLHMENSSRNAINMGFRPLLYVVTTFVRSGLKSVLAAVQLPKHPRNVGYKAQEAPHVRMFTSGSRFYTVEIELKRTHRQQ